MTNQVQQYEPKVPAQYYAVLWQGKAADLVGMPYFNRLVECIVSIDGVGLLKLNLDGEEVKVDTNYHYIVYDTTYGFYVLTRKDFETKFRPVEKVEADSCPI